VDDPDPGVRTLAVRALGNIGSADVDVLAALERSLTHGSDEERWRAARALAKLGPAAVPPAGRRAARRRSGGPGRRREGHPSYHRNTMRKESPMKRILTAVCLVLCASMIWARATAASPATDQAAEKEIRQIEEELRTAVVKGDAATFERVLADDYTTTNVNGLTRTKAQLVADVKSGAAKTASLTLDNIQVRVYGDTAVLTAERTAKSSLRGTDTSGRQRMIRVLVKKQGRWQPVAMQATAMK
jgi:uncharacterized protein (TIGR02246 family)